MNPLIWFGVLIIAAALLVEFLRTPRRSNVLGAPVAEYHAKKTLLVRTEQALFYELTKQLPAGYYIFPHMRLGDIFNTAHGEGYLRRRNLILPKHIDFVIADRYFKPVLAIELNGNSHSNPRQLESDRLKNEIFRNTGLPLETINVGEQYSDEVARILSQHLKSNT